MPWALPFKICRLEKKDLQLVLRGCGDQLMVSKNIKRWPTKGWNYRALHVIYKSTLFTLVGGYRREYISEQSLPSSGHFRLIDTSLLAFSLLLLWKPGEKLPKPLHLEWQRSESPSSVILLSFLSDSLQTMACHVKFTRRSSRIAELGDSLCAMT